MSPEEQAQRAAVIAEAERWLGTPYHSNGDVIGAGVDCGMLLVRAFCDTGVVPMFDPRPYPAQWALHRNEEIYLNLVLRFGTEFEGPPKPADVVLFKFGRCWAHGAIVIKWPKIIHANPTTMDGSAPCRYDDWVANSELHRRTPRFFTAWPKNKVE